MLLSLPIYVELSEEKTLSLNLNTYRNTHHYQLNDAKVLFGDEVRYAVRKLPVMKRVRLIYTLFTKTMRKCDVANVCSVVDKFFSDVLVDEGKLPDDNYEHLDQVTYRFGAVDRENPRCDVLIEDLDDELRFALESEPEEDMQFSLSPDQVQEALQQYVDNLDVLKAGTKFDMSIQPDGSAKLNVLRKGGTMPRHPDKTNEPREALDKANANAVAGPDRVPTNQGQAINQEAASAGSEVAPRPAVTPGALERERTITDDSGVGTLDTAGEAPKPIATTDVTVAAPNFVRSVEVPESAAPQQGPEGGVVVNTASSENPFGGEDEGQDAEADAEAAANVDRGSEDQAEAEAEGQDAGGQAGETSGDVGEAIEEAQAPAEKPKETKKRIFSFGNKAD